MAKKYLGEAGTQALIDNIKENQSNASGSGDIITFDLGTIDLSKYPAGLPEAYYAELNKSKELITIIKELKTNPKPLFVYGKYIHLEQPATFQFQSMARLFSFPGDLGDILIFYIQDDEILLIHNTTIPDNLILEVWQGENRYFPQQ